MQTYLRVSKLVVKTRQLLRNDRDIFGVANKQDIVFSFLFFFRQYFCRVFLFFCFLFLFRSLPWLKQNNLFFSLASVQFCTKLVKSCLMPHASYPFYTQIWVPTQPKCESSQYLPGNSLPLIVAVVVGASIGVVVFSVDVSGPIVATVNVTVSVGATRVKALAVMPPSVAGAVVEVLVIGATAGIVGGGAVSRVIGGAVVGAVAGGTVAGRAISRSTVCTIAREVVGGACRIIGCTSGVVGGSSGAIVTGVVGGVSVPARSHGEVELRMKLRKIKRIF